MGDFFQNGDITTFHKLGHRSIEDLEAQLVRFDAQRPIALVLPCLYAELERPALAGIVDVLKDVPYLSQVVISLGLADEEQYAHAREYFSVLNQEVRIIWNEGPELQRLYSLLGENNISPGGNGKGRAAWIAYGYILAAGKADVIALHDCDILTFDRNLLARLCYPVAHPNIDFAFCKGYYARVSDRLNGRVTRLFVTPLIRSLEAVIGDHPFLKFFDSFRYPLAGEFAMDVDLARRNRIPADWGLEVGVLAEVYRNCSIKQTCQVDIADNYDHKHQPVSADDPEKGLHRMAIDIAQSLFRTLGSMGARLDGGAFRGVKATYMRTAEDFVERYAYDAMLNGLHFRRHREEHAVEVFAGALETAANRYMQDPLGAPLIPNWKRVSSAIPEFMDMLRDAVESEKPCTTAIL